MLCHASLAVSSFPSGCYSYQVEILQNKHKPIVRAGLQTVGQEISSDIKGTIHQLGCQNGNELEFIVFGY